MASQELSGGSLHSESRFLELIQRHAYRSFGAPSREIGIGDDAALVKVSGDDMVITADAMVDGAHFRKGQISWRDLGWKGIVSNQSDIAAMGALPQHALLTLAVTREESIGQIEELFSGVVDALERFGGRLVGGDTVLSEALSVGVTMTGVGVSKDTAMRRDKANPGDSVAVSGFLGGSAGGLMLLEDASAGSSCSEEDREALLAAHFRPFPRTDLVRTMLDAEVRCAMDVSDGLLIDLKRLCTASGVDAVVRADAVPVHTSVRGCFPHEAVRMALTGGEDYELLYAASASAIAEVNESQPESVDRDFGVIGEFVGATDGVGGDVTVLDADGDEIEIEYLGWDHFAS